MWFSRTVSSAAGVQAFAQPVVDCAREGVTDRGLDALVEFGMHLTELWSYGIQTRTSCMPYTLARSLNGVSCRQVKG